MLVSQRGQRVKKKDSGRYAGNSKTPELHQMCSLILFLCGINDVTANIPYDGSPCPRPYPSHGISHDFCGATETMNKCNCYLLSLHLTSDLIFLLQIIFLSAVSTGR